MADNVYTIEQLLTLPVEETIHRPYELINDRERLVGVDTSDLLDISPSFSAYDWELDGLDIRVLKDFWFDHRRFWRLALVVWRDVPCMLVQNAGREGYDYQQHYVIDRDTYLALCLTVKTHLMYQRLIHTPVTVVNPAAKNVQYTDFYGNSLSGYFSRHDW